MNKLIGLTPRSLTGLLRVVQPATLFQLQSRESFSPSLSCLMHIPPLVVSYACNSLLINRKYILFLFLIPTSTTTTDYDDDDDENYQLKKSEMCSFRHKRHPTRTVSSSCPISKCSARARRASSPPDKQPSFHHSLGSSSQTTHSPQLLNYTYL